MNKPWIIALASTALAVGCSSQSEEPVQAEAPVAEVNVPEAPAEPSPELSEIAGVVAETMDSGGYTYVLIDTGDEKVWAAASKVVVAVGDEVTIRNPLPMVNYHSRTLDRTFDRIYFVDSLGLPVQVPEGHGMPSQETPPEVTGIEKAEGGVTVADVFEKKDELVGTEIVVRGKVVKFNAAILDTNWIHVQDGTGSEGTNDLTVTTDATVEVGDIVLLRGTLEADVDFGFGYEYDLIVQDAQVTVE